MATRNFRYDHPAYLVPVVGNNTTTTAGAAGVGAKFVAFTSMLMKSATIMVQVAGTTTAAAANDFTFFKVNGTTTTSVGYSGNLGTTVAFTAGTQVTLSGTLTKGEMLCAKHGTDATQTAHINYEFLIAPGADVTQ
jgi:hypothetical protein